MKKIIYILLLSPLFALNINAQDVFGQILADVEANNTTLKAYREQANADKIGNKTGLNMSNPEVDFGHKWGTSAGENDAFELNVSQSFDFPTAYRHKSQLAKEKNKQVDIVYDQQRRDILQQARLVCIELTYQLKINKRLVERVGYAKELSEAYEKRFDKGDLDVLERNKAKLDFLNMEKLLQMNEVEIELQKSELARLNGGQPVSVSPHSYPDFIFPSDFGEWFGRVKDNNPILRMAEQEVIMSHRQEQLTKSLNLPKITAGYISEYISGSSSQGFMVGLSIPLWEGKNTVKHQKAQTVALQMQHADAGLQFHNILKSQYDKAYKLSELLEEYKETLKVTNDYALLKKALDKGQLSLINYLLETAIYYDTIDKYHETERDYQMAIAALQQWEK